MTYAQLVEEAKKEVASRKDYGKSLNYERCKLWADGDQINLWTYWQGYQIKDVEKGVDILMVGQDWGNPFENNSEQVERIKKIQKGDKGVFYDTTNTTDRNLIHLFKTAFGCDIQKADPGMRLFFTNYSLGYRNRSETGGMTKTLLKEDSELFDKLVEVIKPRIIICLGKLVYEVVSDTRVKGFVEQLIAGEPFVAGYPGKEQIKVYGVAHPGARGTNNVGGMDKMEKVWKKIIIP